MPNKITDLQNAYTFAKIDSNAELTMLYPVVYSNSSKYNEFDYEDKLKNITNFTVNIEQIELFDTFMYIFIKNLKNYCEKNEILFIIKSNDSLEFVRFMEFLNSKKSVEVLKEKQSWLVQFFQDLGNSSKAVFYDTIKFIEFIGETFKKIIALPKNWNKVRWEDFPPFLIRVGVNSLGICLLIVFLIGIIIGYVGAIQLARFGVGSFLAALVGIAVTRELSPLMVGIIIAGRTGSSFTAEIGTMGVSEEIDAITSFGFDKYYFIVIPRLLATIISVPILVSICNIAGIFGGYVAGATMLGTTFNEFKIQLLNSSLRNADIIGGVLKAVVFGWIIGIVGCFKGFRVTGGAESVGKYTTSSVVTSIFLIILLDAIFAFII